MAFLRNPFETERAADASVSQQDDPIILALRDATIGDYEILAELGRGGMAVVYLAHDLALDRKVAIKVLFPSLLTGEGAAERFKREARTAASLNHPNIIPIYAVNEHEALLYFVMRFVGGRGLDSVLEERGTLSIPMVQAILNEVGEALGYAHRRGVIHRDIKPANILLDEEGRAVVTDFGIAKVTAADSITQTGGVVGTPSYMSPEQCTADEVDGASDQYSLGLVGYEMLTGDRPFTGDSVMQLMYLRCTQDPPPIAEARPDCPKGLAQAVMRMLKREPENRWDSVESGVEAIGTGPSGEREAVRREMAELARSGRSRRISMGIRTPTSPVPATKEHADKSTAAMGTERDRTGEGGIRRLVLRWAVPALALIAVLSWLVLRGGGPTPEVAPASLVSVEGASSSGSIPAAPATLELTPSSLTLDIGAAEPFVVQAMDASGAPMPEAPIDWATSDPSVARVSALGIVSGLKAGLATITARSGSASITSTVTVRALPADAPRELVSAATRAVRSIELFPAFDTLAVGGTRSFAAELRGAAGNALAGRMVTWTSSTPSVASVSRTGVVTALGEGTVRITALSEGVSQSTLLVVVPAPVARIEITPPAPSVAVGETVRLIAVLRGSNGQRLGNRPVVWSSGAPGFVTVSSKGVVTGVAAGSADIMASSGGRETRVVVTITAGTPAVAAPAPAQPTAVQTRRDIEGVIAAFAQAVESRDIAQLRRAYPGMTQPQVQAYQGLFRNVQRLGLSLTVDPSLDIQGNTAHATGAARYRYYEPRELERTFPYRATLERTSGTWQLTSISFGQQ